MYFASLGNQIGPFSDEIVAARAETLEECLEVAREFEDFVVWTTDDDGPYEIEI